ncbi:ATP-binding protein [Actinomadura sp. 3N508]|uniref:ATP-binding protein n=1 Tax=Actinomadura sp. 3N508 TaxID=3375153 RepID=UPI0037AB531C
MGRGSTAEVRIALRRRSVACWTIVHFRLAGPRPLLRSRRLLAPDCSGEFVIDARALSFATPLELTAMTALAHSHAAEGERMRLLLPDEPAVTSYLERMDLLNRLPDQCKSNRRVPARGRADRSHSLLEITPVRSPHDGELAGERVFGIVRGNLGDRLGKLAFKVVGELIDNAVSHGRSETGSFVAAQVYPRQRRLEFAVCDTGVGVLEHLKGNPLHRDLERDQEALFRALQPGVTGEREDRGNGLPDLLDMAGGAGLTRLLIRSGDGSLDAFRGVPGPTTRIGSVPDPVKGTWAWLRVRFP